MKRIITALLASLVAGAAAASGGFATLCPNELKELIFKGQKHLVVDVQTPADFRDRNYENSLPTAGEVAALVKLAAANASGDYPVVVVGKSGGEEESRAAGELVKGGINPKRIRILEGGMDAAVSSSGCGCCKIPEGSK